MAGSKPKTAGDDEQADDGGAGAAAVESELTQERLIAAIRTLVAMGSCWLDRDSELRGPDEKQRKRLLGIVEQLEKAALAQREHAEELAATMFRDAVAARLGSRAEVLPEGHSIMAERTKRAARGDGFVLRAYNVSLKGIFAPAEPTSASDDAVEALRFGHRHWIEQCGGSPVWSYVRPTVSRAFLRQVVDKAIKGLNSKEFSGPQDAASYAVGRVLGYDESDDLRVVRAEAALAARALEAAKRRESQGKKDKGTGGEDPAANEMDVIAEDKGMLRARKKFQRIMDERRPTRVDGAAMVPDTGTYFGARPYLGRYEADRSKANSRAWSAAQLLAAAADGGQALAEAIFDEQRESPSTWHIWRGSAHGYSVRPHKSTNSSAVHHAMEEFRRGYEPNWPDASTPLVAPFRRSTGRKWCVEHGAAITASAKAWHERLKSAMESDNLAAVPSAEAAVAACWAVVEALVGTDAPNPMALWQAGHAAAAAKLSDSCSTSSLTWELAAVEFAVAVSATFPDYPGRWPNELAEVQHILLQRQHAKNEADFGVKP